MTTADNVTLNLGIGGATVRTVEKTVNSVDVQVQSAVIDLGGGTPTENLLTGGQSTMANSLPVVLASDQTAIPTTAAQLPATLGQKAMAASLPVTLASDQSTIAVSTVGMPANMTLQQLAREGRYTIRVGGASSGFSTNTPPTVTANAQIGTVNAPNPVPMGRLYSVLSGEVGASDMCESFFQDAGLSQTENNTAQANYIGDAWTLTGFIPPGGGSSRIMPNGGILVPEYHGLSLGIINNTTVGAFFSAHMELQDITNDPFWEAKYKICVLGDSIGWTMPGSNGVTSNSSPKAIGRQLWAFNIVERLRDKGASVRLINKSFGGAQSMSAYVRILSDGWIDFPYDLFIIALGMNDAVSNAGVNVYQGNIQSAITQARRVNPNCSIIVAGPSSTNDPLRQYAQIVAASSSGTAATSSTVTLPSSAGVSAGNLVFVTTTGTNGCQYATLGTQISGNQWNIVGGWPLGTPTGTLTIGVYNQNTSPIYINNYRTLAQAAVTAMGGSAKDIWYYDASTAYSASGTDLTNCFGDFAPGTPAVHSNAAGQQLYANGIAPVVQQTNFYTQTLKFSGPF